MSAIASLTLTSAEVCRGRSIPHKSSSASRWHIPRLSPALRERGGGYCRFQPVRRRKRRRSSPQGGRPRRVPVERKIIAAFADRTDHIAAHQISARLRLPYREDFVVRVVKRRPDQIVHRRIDDHETLVLALLEIDDRSDQRAGIANDRSARLQNYLAAEGRGALRDDFGVCLWRGRRVVVVAISNAESAADIEVVD